MATQYDHEALLEPQRFFRPLRHQERGDTANIYSGASSSCLRPCRPFFRLSFRLSYTVRKGIRMSVGNDDVSLWCWCWQCLSFQSLYRVFSAIWMAFCRFSLFFSTFWLGNWILFCTASFCLFFIIFFVSKCAFPCNLSRIFEAKPVSSPPMSRGWIYIVRLIINDWSVPWILWHRESILVWKTSRCNVRIGSYGIESLF